MKKVMYAALLSLLGVITFSFLGIEKSSSKSTETICSSRNVDGLWSFSAHPFMGDGYESRPVVVSAVRTTAKTLTVTEVRIRNISSKPVTTIRLGWFITNEKDGKSETLLDGESQTIPLEKTLAIGDTVLLKLPVMSFSETRDALTAKQALKGNFDAYVFVKNIMFEDKTKWNLGEKVEIKKGTFDPSIVNATFAGTTNNLHVLPLNKAAVCPKQACRYVSETPPGYTCASSENDEYCTNCVTSCCSTVCSDPSPSCGPCN